MSDQKSEQNAENSAPSTARIPKAIFVDDVDQFMSKAENETAEHVLMQLEEQHQKYKFMEYNLATKKSRLKSQIPEIKSCLDIIKHQKSQKETDKPMLTHFQLSDQVFVKCKIPPTDKICLWLGANVMLEYDLDEAEELLQKNIVAAKNSLDQTEDDLGYIRDQKTTIEVNMARIYNWDVKRRKAQEGSSN